MIEKKTRSQGLNANPFPAKILPAQRVDYTPDKPRKASKPKMTKVHNAKPSFETTISKANLSISHQMLWLIATIMLSISLKVAILAADVVPFNSDEAVIALMAKHISQGSSPIFFYGQAYMGSLDAFLVAGGFAVFGQQVWVIRLVQTCLYMGTILTTAWLGKIVFKSWQSGILAALLLAIPTVNLTLYTTVSIGNYGEMLVIGNLLLLVGFRLAENLDKRIWDKQRWLWLLWGFLAGLGFWAIGLTLAYVAPVGLYLTWKSRSLWWDRKKGSGEGSERWRGALKLLGITGSGFVIGSSPWSVYALTKSFGTLIHELNGGAVAGVGGLSGVQQVWWHLLSLLLFGSTVIMGIRPPWEIRWLVLPLLPFVIFFWIAVCVYFMRGLRSGRFLRGPAMVIAGVGIALIAGFILTPFGADPSGRYFLPLMIPLYLIAADFVTHLRQRWGRWAYGLVGFLLLYNLAGTIQSAAECPPCLSTQAEEVAQIDRRYDDALVSFLRANGERYGYTNYWISYPLAFRSNEELIYVPRLPYHLDWRYTERDDRYPAYGEVVAEADRIAYITAKHPDLDKYLRTRFSELDVKWNEKQIGDYRVFYQLSRAVRPQEIRLGKTTP